MRATTVHRPKQEGRWLEMIPRMLRQRYQREGRVAALGDSHPRTQASSDRVWSLAFDAKKSISLASQQLYRELLSLRQVPRQSFNNIILPAKLRRKSDDNFLFEGAPRGITLKKID
jgi:hypothetical protein